MGDESASGQSSTFHARGSTIAGIEAPLIDQRATVILVIDSTQQTALAAEIARFKNDLAGDGWTVIELLRNYLRKNHEFRHRLGDFAEIPRRGVIRDSVGLRNGEVPASAAWRSFAAMFGSANITETSKWFPTLETNKYLWAYGNGPPPSTWTYSHEPQNPDTYTSSSGIGTSTDFKTRDSFAVFNKAKAFYQVRAVVLTSTQTEEGRIRYQFNGGASQETFDNTEIITAFNRVFLRFQAPDDEENPGGGFRLDDVTVEYLSAPIKSWRTAHFTLADLADPALEAALWGNIADPDGDGIPNLLEYALGGSPLIAGTAAPVLSGVLDQTPHLGFVGFTVHFISDGAFSTTAPSSI